MTDSPIVTSPVPGWITETDLMFLQGLVDSFRDGVLVEVGVALGRTTSALAARALNRDTRYVCVDTFMGSSDSTDSINQFYRRGCGPFFRKAFEYNCRAIGIWDDITLLEMSGVEAASRFDRESVNMCFIDADHRYEAVKEDIESWWPRIISGGWLSGHDWNYDSETFPIRRAVNEFVGENGLSLRTNPGQGNCWAIEKPNSR